MYIISVVMAGEPGRQEIRRERHFTLYVLKALF